MSLFPPLSASALALILWLLSAASVTAAPRTLFTEPVPSPNRALLANAVWDDTGFIGRIGIQIFDASGHLLHDVELPEIDPALSDLLWLNDEWVVTESSLGTRGSGLLYVHAPTGRGYLLEMVTLRAGSEWEFSFATNDSVSSASVPNAAVGRTSLFPIQLRDLPTDPTEFFRPAFPAQLADAGTAFCDFRRRCGFDELELLAGPDIHPQLGALLLARFDEEPRIVYFPTGTTTPAEMLSRVRLEPLNETALRALECPEDVEITLRWEDTAAGDYIVEALSGWEEDGVPATTPLMRGHFADVFDTPPPPPGALLPADTSTTAGEEQDIAAETAAAPPVRAVSKASKAKSALVSGAKALSKKKGAAATLRKKATRSSRRR